MNAGPRVLLLTLSERTSVEGGTGLYAAVEVKLGEQRRFVLWWDGQGDKRGRPPEKTSLIRDVLPRVSDFGLDRETLRRWRKRLGDDDDYKQALEAEQERCRRVCEAE